MTIQLLPAAILSFSTWVYRIEIQVPPGKRVEARWTPHLDAKYSFIVAETPLGAPPSDYNYSLWRVFANYTSGYALAFHNEMAMVVSMPHLVSIKDLQDAEGRSSITVVTFNALPMDDMCDARSEEHNVTVSRLVMDNSEVFWVQKSSFRYEDQLSCRLTFRAQTDDVIFMARVWITSVDECISSRLFILIGSRHVPPCGTNTWFFDISLLLMIQMGRTSSIGIRFPLIISSEISVLAYVRNADVSVDGSNVPGFAGHLITTCPLAESSSAISQPSSTLIKI